MAKHRPCLNCEGTGKVPLLNSWFVEDGYRLERCGICSGTGKNPPGYTQWPGHAGFLRRFHERVSEWGGLTPKADRASTRLASDAPLLAGARS